MNGSDRETQGSKRPQEEARSQALEQQEAPKQGLEKPAVSEKPRRPCKAQLLWDWGRREAVRLVFGFIGALSLSFAGYLLSISEPHGTAAATLVGLALISVFLAVGGEGLIRRITRLGPSGIELDPETRESVDELLFTGRPPKLEFALFEETAGPWEPRDLTYEQRWYYQLGSDLLLHLQHRGIEITRLSRDDLDRFRGLTLWVGKAALIDNEPAKALDMLRGLEPLQAMTPEELLHLATAYVWMAEAPFQKSRHYLEQARLRLADAAEKDPGHPMIQWTLGYVYDELEYFKLAVEANQRSVEIDAKFAPWAYWNTAVSQLKNGDKSECIKALEAIPRGPWWHEVYRDDELKPLKVSDYADRFLHLYVERKSPYAEQYRST